MRTVSSKALILLVSSSAFPGSLANFDEFQTCDRLYQTRRTARLLDHVPCDMTKTTFCEYKGSAYPEHSIWRFKEENKALMRRMYGDVDSNEIYREMRSNGMFAETHSRQAGQPVEQAEHDPTISNMVNNLIPFDENTFNGLHYNIRVGSGLAMVHNTKDETVKKAARTTRAPVLRTRTRVRTRLRPRTTKKTTQGTTTRTVVTVLTTTSSTTSTRMGTVSSVATTDVPTTTQPPTTIPILTTEQQQTIQPTTAETELMSTTQQQQFSTTQESTLSEQITEDDGPNPETSTQSSAVYQQEYESFVEEMMEYNNDNESDEDYADESTEYVDESADYSEESAVVDSSSNNNNNNINQDSIYVEEPEIQYVDEQGVPLSEEDIKNLDPAILEAALPNLEGDELEEDEEETILQAFEAELSEEEEEVEEQPQPLPQQQQHIQYTGDSVNACPVYVEVKAPFWANNTRSKTLALLNLYPFEQYIHMEKCKDEGGEMLCRPGCRCEQQYRLHRLLAFDPDNECRGIFSDWFSFPSFCLCKCYNVPEQIIETMNRLPKSLDMEETKKEQHGASTAEDNKKHQHAGPGPTHNKNNRLENHRMPKHDNRFDSKENRFVSNENRFESSDHQRGFSQPDSSIPAIFPYEGKAAIMAEMDRQIQRESSIWNKDDPKKKDKSERSENEVLKAVEEDDLERIAEAHIDNTVEDDIQHARKSVKEGRAMDEHFFYNNPILEFKLADGTTGSVVETPRK